MSLNSPSSWFVLTFSCHSLILGDRASVSALFSSLEAGGFLCETWWQAEASGAPQWTHPMPRRVHLPSFLKEEFCPLSSGWPVLQGKEPYSHSQNVNLSKRSDGSGNGCEAYFWPLDSERKGEEGQVFCVVRVASISPQQPGLARLGERCCQPGEPTFPSARCPHACP